MTLLECDGQILIADCGLSFPEDEMYGIDIVIPDFTYLIENSEKKIVGMVDNSRTRRPYIEYSILSPEKLKLPIYGTRLTLDLWKNKLKSIA